MKEQLLTAVAPQLLDMAVATLILLCALVVFVLHRGAAYLKQQTAKIKDSAARELIWDAIDRVDLAAEKVVAKIEQTTAAELRQAVKAGKMDRAQLIELGNLALEEIKRTVGPEVLEVLNESLGDLDNYLTSTIESKVLRLKKKR